MSTSVTSYVNITLKTVGHVVLLTLLLAMFTQPLFAGQDEKKLTALKRKIDSLQRELRSQNKQQDIERAALRTIEINAGKIRQQVRTTESQLTRLNKELKSLTQQRNDLERSKQSQQKLIAQHVNTAYRLGQERQIKLLLNEEDPTRFSRMLKYHDYFLKARAEKISTYLATIEKLKQLELEISQRELNLQVQRDSLQSQQSQLNEQISARQVTLATIKQDINSHHSQLKKMHSERLALEQIIAALKEAIANLTPATVQQPFASRKGKLPWPTQGKVTKTFGSIRKADIRWNGMLLSAKQGDAVTAIHVGRVIFSDYLRGHGLLLIIDHGKDYMSLYAHNEVLLKESGDWVSTGDLISRVGNSGGLDSSALYFEIRHNGKPRNPAQWLQQR